MSTNEIIFDGRTFGDGEHKGVQLTRSQSLPAAALGVDTLNVTLEVPSAVRLYTSEGLPIITADGLDLYASGKLGVVFDQSKPLRYLRNGSLLMYAFIKEIKTVGETTAAITAMSPLGRLTQMAHRGGVYAGETLASIVADICGDVPFTIQSNIASIPMYGWLPSVAPSGEDGAKKGSARDNLMRCLFDVGANLWTAGDGSLRIGNLSTEISSTLDAGRVYLNGFADVEDAPVTSVTIYEYQYAPGGDTKTLFDGATTEGQTIHFSEPMSNLVATGFSILASGANYATVSAGSGTLVGDAYIVTIREVTRAVSDSDTANEVRISDTTMVGLTSSSDVIRRLVEFYARRRTLTFDARVEYEVPGDVVAVYNPTTKETLSACISQLSEVSSNIMKGRISALVGFTPWQTTPFEDVRVVLTGAGTFTVPAGVTELTVVLFGGAQGGAAGYRGGDGAAQSVSFTTELGSRYTGYAPGKGGDGGLGGEGGGAGRMLRVDLSVTPGQTISFACGAGGAGGVYVVGGEVGSLGADTTFGAYSTATGAPNAYTDPVTGDVYGADGATGIAGGKGAGFSERPDQSNLFAFEPSESVIVDGVTYAAGSCAESGGKLIFGSSSAAAKGGEPNVVAAASVSLGSGAAAGTAGTNGSLAATGYGTFGGGTGSVSGYANAQAGKNGASASLTPAQAVRGRGGTGGYGGGGGSGIGWAVAATVGSVSLSLQTNTPGVGGDGSDGGQGGDGLIICYYRQPVA